ncbi:MAG: BMP family ABC transporter substrate-binding protein [Clostridia bacterium]|jgi:basic membrane protein A|nr:BMP family ABC transporter substrate-binding protein [Clostridia bacterium]
MKRKLSLFLVIIMAMVILLTGCGGSESEEATGTNDQEKQYKVGFIYVGPIGDGGWSYAQNEGRLYLEEKLGVPTIYKESVPEEAECEKVINDMIDEGCNIIFTTSFGFMDWTERAAKNHPDVYFFHCSGYKTLENMTAYFGRMYQPRYLSGIVAGLKTESNKIGYVAAHNIPEVLRGINAFTLGVRSVNPDATVHVKWTKTWYDPAKEKEAAKALLAEGCDVIAQHQDTAGPQQAAEEAGKWSIGYNTDMVAVAPKAYMTAPIWNWGPYYVEQVQAIMDGTWKSENYWGGMETGIVDLAPLTENAPEGAAEAVEAAKAKILSGENKIFTGPLKDNTGELRVPEGVTLTDQELTSADFNWLVEGVIGTVE